MKARAQFLHKGSQKLWDTHSRSRQEQARARIGCNRSQKGWIKPLAKCKFETRSRQQKLQTQLSNGQNVTTCNKNSQQPTFLCVFTNNPPSSHHYAIQTKGQEEQGGVFLFWSSKKRFGFKFHGNMDGAFLKKPGLVDEVKIDNTVVYHWKSWERRVGQEEVVGWKQVLSKVDALQHSQENLQVTAFEMEQQLHTIQKNQTSMAQKWMKYFQKQNIEFTPSPPGSPEA
ncbi:hypothetical protein JCGZ_19201 [Jatropha curcas]|uniref:Uncharacterized protein n=1 Tax=Jatropha curcas TaxID=180498 RepID=A0A067LJ93_JATCU|nr:hypothetical protein JCGZ_19201 [Jatropha curcas]